MGVTKSEGGWRVRCDGREIGVFPDQRRAWRAYDIAASEPVSRKEDVAEWSSRKND